MSQIELSLQEPFVDVTVGKPWEKPEPFLFLFSFSFSFLFLCVPKSLQISSWLSLLTAHAKEGTNCTRQREEKKKKKNKKKHCDWDPRCFYFLPFFFVQVFVFMLFARRHSRAPPLTFCEIEIDLHFFYSNFQLTHHVLAELKWTEGAIEKRSVPFPRTEWSRSKINFVCCSACSTWPRSLRERPTTSASSWARTATWASTTQTIRFEGIFWSLLNFLIYLILKM